MALATQCPHCGTVFRVAADQLKLRGGMVRCGKCREVFDGNAALVDISLLKAQQDAAAQAQAAAAPEPSSTAAPAAAPAAAPSEYALDFDLSLPPLPQAPATQGIAAEPAPLVIDFDLDLSPAKAPELPSAPEQEPELGLEPEPEPEPQPEPEPEPEPQPEPEQPAATEPTPADEGEPAVDESEGTVPERELSLSPSTEEAPEDVLAGPAHEEEPALAEPEDAEAAELVPSPMASETVHAARPQWPAAADEDIEEPGFVTRVRRKEKLSRVSRVLMAIGSVLLVAALAAQAAIGFGSLLAAKYPQLKPTLIAACKVLQCRIALPERIDALAVETGELQTLGGDTFSYATVLRNQGALAQAWPHLELSLTDASDTTLVRRVIAPREYLPPRTDIARGFAPRSEQSIKVYFELSQVKASGYKIAIFYP